MFETIIRKGRVSQCHSVTILKPKLSLSTNKYCDVIRKSHLEPRGKVSVGVDNRYWISPRLSVVYLLSSPGPGRGKQSSDQSQVVILSQASQYTPAISRVQEVSDRQQGWLLPLLSRCIG